MWTRTALLVAGLAAACSAGAADLFFVVGQTNVTWQGAAIASPAAGDVKVLNWAPTSKNQPSATIAKRDDLSVGPLDGVVPSFASTWSGLTGRPASFAIYRKPEAALTMEGAAGQAYWTDYAGAVYQDAVRSFKAARESASSITPAASDRRYLVWIQDEVDASAGVSEQSYQAKLGELFERFSADVASDGKPLDAIFLVSSGLMREGMPSSLTKQGRAVESGYFDKVNDIVRAQDKLAATGQVVLISRSMRSPLGVCGQGQGSQDCETTDLLRYYAWVYAQLGSEMARNAFVFHAKGIKPLSPQHCSQSPDQCAATVAVYRWVDTTDARAPKAYGTDLHELDGTGYRFIGTRFALFEHEAPGRIPLFRSMETGRYGITVRAPVTATANTAAKPLGYCYVTPTGNAAARLVAVEQGGLTSYVRYPSEEDGSVELDPQREKLLCYVS